MAALLQPEPGLGGKIPAGGGRLDVFLPETIRAMEKSFRDSLASGLPADWIFGESYFLPHEPFADGIVTVNKYTQVPDGGLYSQQILVAKTGNEWRTVKTLPLPLDNEA